MAITDVAEGIRWQADHAERAGAPRTARIIRGTLGLLDGTTDSATQGPAQGPAQGATETGRRMAAWPGRVIEDALPLRVAGGLHHLFLSGEEPRLGAVYSGEMAEQTEVDALVADVVRQHDARLVSWLDSPPQTNEAGRSASVMAALLWLSGRLGLPEGARARFELNEIGASAGINTMMDRYFYDLGGVRAGPSDSRMRIAPEWRGPQPPAGEVEIVSCRGCDRAPVDLTDPAQLLRLKAYVWADATERMGRLDAAAALALTAPPDLVRMDAGDFVEQQLATRQEAGVARVLFHTVMWQYLPPATRKRITAAMEEAGAAATAERPLAWIAVETNRATFRHELTVRCWTGNGANNATNNAKSDGRAVKLAEAHPHGAWVEWFGVEWFGVE